MLYIIASGKAGFSLAGGFAPNGYGLHSSGDYSLEACFVAELVLTFFFLMIIFGMADKRLPAVFVAGWATGQLWLFWVPPLWEQLLPALSILG